MNLELLSMIAFFAVVGILLWRDRKNVEFHGGLVIRRWKGGLEFIDRFIQRHPKFIKISGYIALCVGIIGSIAGLYLLIFAATKMLPGVQLVLPTAAGFKYPGPVIGVPFWYWIIAVFVLLFSHETMHAIFARAAKVPVKNYGIMLFFIIPLGAFVEPDERSVKRLKTGKKLPFMAAGSFGNFIVGATFLILAMILIGLAAAPAITGAFTEPKGVMFNETLSGYPAHYANITGIIKSVDGIEIKTAEDLLNILNNTQPGKTIEIVTNDSTYKIKTVVRPDNQTGSFIGISSASTLVGAKDWVVVTLNLFGWLTLLNIGIGIVNLLPWRPFDGGLMSQEILTRYFRKNGKTIANVIMWLTYGLVFFNLFGVKIIQAIA
jgi:membrane-associated protease RseP (regulator of RpoE activity)